MDQEKRSLFQRIRNARQSLENAEKSFHDDRGIRGELDLMLAEAELKNLRSKQTVPWSWNRNIFALCIAVLLCIAGLCGWYFAQGAARQANREPQSTVAEQEQRSDLVAKEPAQKNEAATVTGKLQEKNAAKEEDKSQEVYLSKQDLRNLVRSAKTELGSGK